MGIGSLPVGKNPINARVSTPLLADLLARGKAGGYPADIKLIYSAGGGLFNQAPNVKRYTTMFVLDPVRTSGAMPTRAPRT